LDADWVILSACNTAAAEALGAEALSGLARAFFFAGARSLLVSHWPVRSLASGGSPYHRRDQRDAGQCRSRPRRSSAQVDDCAAAGCFQRGVRPSPAVCAPFVGVGEGGDNLASSQTTPVTAKEAAALASGAEVLPRHKSSDRASRPATSQRRSKHPPARKPAQSNDGDWLSNLFGQY
jgi:hypothetical protein